MKLIEVDRLKEGLEYHRQPTDQDYEVDRQWAVGYNAGLERALYSISCAPAIDPVHAAGGCYCGECVYGEEWENSYGVTGFLCNLFCADVDPNGFCSHGRRREGADG